MMSINTTARRIVTVGLLAGTATLGLGITGASAVTKPVVMPGVTLENMWMNCNAAGGDYYEEPDSSVCVLPSGQVVTCSKNACVLTMSNPRTPTRPAPPRTTVPPIIGR